MATYINVGNSSFRDYRNDIYVDKTGLIEVINKTLNTQRRYSCVTRCRRFGKSMVANNDAAIFLPVTGDKNGSDYALSYGGFYWTSSLYGSTLAWRIQFYDTRVNRFDDYRYYGEYIRPAHP